MTQSKMPKTIIPFSTKRKSSMINGFRIIRSDRKKAQVRFFNEMFMEKLFKKPEGES